MSQGQPPQPGQNPQGPPPPEQYPPGPPPPGQYPPQPPQAQPPLAYKGFNPWCCGPIEKGAHTLAIIDLTWSVFLVVVTLALLVITWATNLFCPTENLKNSRDLSGDFCKAIRIALTIVLCLQLIVLLLGVSLAVWGLGIVKKRKVNSMKCWMIWAIIIIVFTAISIFYALAKDNEDQYLTFGEIAYYLFKIYQTVVMWYFFKALQEQPPVVTLVYVQPSMMSQNQDYPPQQQPPPPQEQQG